MSAYREPLEYIHHSVQSILVQTYKDLELIVAVDDPKNTTLIAALEEYAAQDSRVKLHINTKNLGPAGARNAALSRATGEYIAILDADDYSLPDRLEKQLRFIEETGADLVGAPVCFFDTDIVARAPYFSEKCLKRYLPLDCALTHSSWFARKAVYDALCGYRDIPKAEDFDFLLRAHLAGFKILMQDQHLIHYRINPNGDSQTALLQQFLTAQYLRKNKNHPERVNRETINKDVLPKLTEKALNAFSSADATAKELIKIKKSAPVKWMFLRIKATLSSKYFLMKYLHALRLKLIRKIYS